MVRLRTVEVRDQAARKSATRYRLRTALPALQEDQQRHRAEAPRAQDNPFGTRLLPMS